MRDSSIPPTIWVCLFTHNAHSDMCKISRAIEKCINIILMQNDLMSQSGIVITVKILKFGTPQTIAIIVLKIEKFDVTLH